MHSTRFQHFTGKVLSILLCLLIQPPLLAVPAFADQPLLSANAIQAAEILGVRHDAELIAALRRNGSQSEDSLQQLRIAKSLVLRKILQGILQVQAAENHLESEMAYTYDLIARQQRKVDNVNQAFNIVNFSQLGILYGIMEPYSRIHKQFIQSAVGTCTGSGLAIGLPVLNILYNKYSKAHNLTPPAFLSHTISGKAVDGTNAPAMVRQYLDLPEPGSNISRREALNNLWKQRYKADMSRSETLCAIDDGKPKSTATLNTRIVLLWSLFTAIQGFDKDLLSLLTQITDYQPVGEMLAKEKFGTTTGLTSEADEAARLLHLEPLVTELRSLNASGPSARKTDLQITLMESILCSYLDMQIAVDRCQEELNFQYDIVLAQLSSRKNKFLQKTFEANFIQTGTLGACAGWCYLNHYGKAGNQLFIIENSLGLGITTVSLLATHGGWRKNQTEPNSLADFFNLRSAGKHGFTPLVWNFLNSSLGRTDGKTRSEYLKELWSKDSVATVDLKDQRSLEKLGSMPSCKWDTIKIASNRIALLTSLSEQLGLFNSELLALLRQTWPSSSRAETAEIALPISASARDAAALLGVSRLVSDLGNRQQDEDAKLTITRNVLEGFLDASAEASLLAHEIVAESQVVNRMTRQRDMAIQLTNIANFYQIGVLGIISDSLGLSSDKHRVLAGDRINLVSGGLILGLAAGAAVERRGGLRPGKVAPNHIAAAFKGDNAQVKLSPLMARYLNTHSPLSQNNMSRREEMIKYWKDSKLLTVDVSRESNIEKLSAQGKAHHWWNENIKLINNRITMMYDLRALLRSSNVGFDDLLVAIN